MKLAFTPVSIAGGLVAGIVGKKIFEKAWGAAAGAEPPDPEHREVEYGKLILALMLEGAIFRLVKGLADHGLRHAFAKGTGAWPGEEQPDRN